MIKTPTQTKITKKMADREEDRAIVSVSTNIRSSRKYMYVIGMEHC